MSSRTELSALADRYDVVVIGGGITGAGVLREAVRSGARVLLVEGRDFASGTSSGSSKLVHGGLRYLKNGQWRLTLESVRERQRLLDEAPGLVDAQPFLMPIYAGRKPGRWLMQLGLGVYDLMAGAHRSRWLPAAESLALEPDLAADGLLGAMAYEDARTDDARLVLRLIFDAVAAGAAALNYVRAEPLRADDGRVRGVRLHDAVSGAGREIAADLVVNATGAWAAAVAGGSGPRLRPLRGSHLVFPASRFPLRHAVSWLHPRDQRPVFAYPWEGAVLYGTTDLDHGETLELPRISAAEVEYLIAGLVHQFPRLQLTARDALCSYAGVRPVVDGGKADPSSESRESALWSEPGMIGITGGKLTTFRVTARSVLRAAATQLPQLAPGPDRPVFESAQAAPGQRRLYGRLGVAAGGQVLRDLAADEQQPLGATPYSIAELRWAARREAVVHLQDLMMRRTRLGLVCADGGAEFLPRILDICRQELGWDQARCAQEEAAYRDYWQAQHALPQA